MKTKKVKTMNKEVAKQEPKNQELPAVIPAAAVPALKVDSQEFEFNKKDLLISKLLLLQGSSALVNEGKAANGDIINSLTEEKLADKTKTVEIIPISNFSTWVTLEKGSGKYVSSQPYIKGTELEYEAKHTDGRIVNNFYTINVYALLAKQVEEGAALPVLISFRSKSLMTGKKLITSHFLFCQMAGAKPYSKSIQLGCVLSRNEKGNFHTFNISSGKKTSPEAIEMAKMWEGVLKQGDLKVDEASEAKVERNVDQVDPEY